MVAPGAGLPLAPLPPLPPLPAMTRRQWVELCAYGRLAAAGVVGAAGIAESLHHAIARVALPLGRAPAGRIRGIPRLVYASIRGVTRLVDRGLEIAAGAAEHGVAGAAATPAREAWRAAVNGVFGDHLAATGNPLAIPMQLRRAGVPLPAQRAALASLLPRASERVVVLVHGLCRNDLQWRQDGHDHGAALEREHGYTALYLHYNTGRPIATNGAEFARLLEALRSAWPVPLHELTVVGHSMGGLVARSAVAAARRDGLAWADRLRRLVFLGTPHHGARWERLGQQVESALRVSPYSAPFAVLGAARSAGITDLRHGDATPLPEDVDCHAIAATLGRRASALRDQVVGDGLVPLDSALGVDRPGFEPLRFAQPHRWVARGTSHLGLLADAAVYARLSAWLAAAPVANRAARHGRRRQRGSGQR